MKKFVITLCLFFVAGNVQADDCSQGRKVTEYNCMSPCDVFVGVGCYLKDATCRVGDGLGTILTAPFKAKACFPEPQRFRYTAPKFRWCPPKFERVKPELQMPKIYEGEKIEGLQFPLHRDPEPNTFWSLAEIRF